MSPPRASPSSPRPPSASPPSSPPAGRGSTAHAIDLLAECVVRLAISYAALPTGPAGMTAASVATLLGPYLEQVVAEGERGG